MKTKRKAATVTVHPETAKRVYAKWTEDELALLRELSEKGMSSPQIAKVITTHTLHSITAKRTQLSIAFCCRRWTRKEEDTLKYMWKQRKPIDEIAKAINRTPCSVAFHAQKMNLRKRVLFDESAIAFIKNNYHRMRTHFIASELNVTVQQVKDKAVALGLKARP